MAHIFRNVNNVCLSLIYKGIHCYSGGPAAFPNEKKRVIIVLYSYIVAIVFVTYIP